MCILCRVFEGGQHVVFESSQTMNDIPFGDHFTVESRWDFSAQPSRAARAAQTLVGLSIDLNSCRPAAPRSLQMLLLCASAVAKLEHFGALRVALKIRAGCAASR